MQDSSIISISADERGNLAGRFVPILSRVLGRAKNLSAQEATIEATNQANRIEKNAFDTASSRREYYEKMTEKMAILTRKAELMDNQQAQEPNRPMEATGPYAALPLRDPRHAPTAQQHIELLQQHTQNAQANMHQNNYAHSNASHPSQGQAPANSYHQQGVRSLQADSTGQHSAQGHNSAQEMHAVTRTMPGANGRTNYPHTTSQGIPTQNTLKGQVAAATQPKRPTQAPNAPPGLQAAPTAQSQRPQTNNQPVAHPGTVKLGTTLPQMPSQTSGTTGFPRTAPNANPYSNPAHPHGYHGGVNMPQQARQDMNNPQNPQMRMPPGYHQGIAGTDGMSTYNVAGHGANGVGRPGRAPANGGVPTHGAGMIPTHILKEKWALLAEQMHKVSNPPKDWVELGKKYLPTSEPLTDLSVEELHALNTFAEMSLSAKGTAKGAPRQTAGIANPSKPLNSDNIAPMSETPHSHHAPNLVPGVPQTLKNVAPPSATTAHAMPGAHASMNLGGSQAATALTEATNIKLQQTAGTAPRTHIMPAGGVPKTVQSYPRAASQNRSMPSTQPMGATGATNSNAHSTVPSTQTGGNGVASHTTNAVQASQSAAAAKVGTTGVGASGRGTGPSGTSGANNAGNHPSNGTAPAVRGTGAIAGQTGNPVPATPTPVMSLEKARETLLTTLPTMRDVNRIRAISLKVKECLGGFAPTSIDNTLFMLPEVPWWERTKRKVPTESTLSTDSHTISSSIIQFKRSKTAESTDSSTTVQRPFTVKVLSESNATLIQTMKAVQGLREEINNFCSIDHFFSLRYLQLDLAIIVPSIVPFNSEPPSHCSACSEPMRQDLLSSNILASHPSSSDYLHHSQPHAESSAMQTDQDSQMLTSGTSENMTCCSSSTSLHSNLNTKNKDCCVLGLVLDLRSPQYALADDFGAPRIVPHFSVRGCRFGRTFANTLKNMEENLKPTMKPRNYVRHVLERYKSWVQALAQMENELRDPIFHEVTFQEAARNTTRLTSAKSLHLSRQNQSAQRQYSTSKKCRSQSYIKAHCANELEFGISFSSKGYPDLFVVLPAQYPVTGVQVVGIDSPNVNIKSKMFNAVAALQHSTLTEILHAWLIFGAPA